MFRKLTWMAALASALLVGAVVAPAAPAGAATASVWVGSPVDGRWASGSGCAGAVFPSSACSLPSVHWWLANAPSGDWAVDLQVGAGAGVYLYVAPQSASSVTTKVEAVRAACASGVVSDGGYMVTVGIWSGSTKIGSVTYAHVQPAVSAGQVVNRWGTKIGTVWSRSGYTSCWRGAHVHFQAYNQSGYSCYNRGWQPSQAMARSNFVGFVGGSYASGPRRACP